MKSILHKAQSGEREAVHHRNSQLQWNTEQGTQSTDSETPLTGPQDKPNETVVKRSVLLLKVQLTAIAIGNRGHRLKDTSHSTQADDARKAESNC